MSRSLLTTIVLTALAVLVLLLWATILSPPKKIENTEIRTQKSVDAPTVTFIDPVRGPRGAEIKIVEYGDFLCSACATVEETLKTVLAAHPEVALVWKSVPDTRIRRGADRVAEVAHCAGTEGKFWELHDALLAKQDGLTEDAALSWGSSLGLGATFRACVAARDTRVQIERSVEEAVALGIDGMPYFFVGNERLSGAPTVQEFEAAIERALP